MGQSIPPETRPPDISSPGGWPSLNLDHLRRLTDETGIIQHAVYSIPDLATGYTTDDNARALAVAVRGQAAGFEVTDLAAKYVALLYYLQANGGRYWHGLDYSRQTMGGVGGEDTQGRALLACATVMHFGASPTARLSPGLMDAAEVARRMWGRALAAERPEGCAGERGAASPREGGSLNRKGSPIDVWRAFRYPRGQALMLLALAMCPQAARDPRGIAVELGSRLVEEYHHTAGPGWHWFEDALTYANALLPHGLLAAYRLSEEPDFLAVATDTLDFLLEVLFPAGYLRLVGNKGWYLRHGERALFDEQPVDAGHVVECCLEAYRLTGHGRYREAAGQAMAWFHGVNVLGVPVYQETTGGVFDGLGPEGPNLNQGAESVLSYLSARLAWLEQFAPRGEPRGVEW